MSFKFPYSLLFAVGCITNFCWDKLRHVVFTLKQQLCHIWQNLKLDGVSNLNIFRGTVKPIQ